MSILDRSTVIEKYRKLVLDALDDIAEQVFEEYAPKQRGKVMGVRDSDLPELFKVIDALAEKVAERGKVNLVEMNLDSPTLPIPGHPFAVKVNPWFAIYGPRWLKE